MSSIKRPVPEKVALAPVMELLEHRTFFNATGWSDVVDNALMPLSHGMTWTYKGAKSGTQVLVRTAVQRHTKVVDGVRCITVLDRAFQDGKLAENTLDYYAQDTQGNVWYFGEKSQKIDRGRVVSTAGSWMAGVNGAQPGIIMQAAPAVGQSYFQEYAAGVAQDQAEVLTASTNFVQTREFTMLEPDSTEVKFYAAGIGVVKQHSLTGEPESLQLVSFQSK